MNTFSRDNKRYCHAEGCTNAAEGGLWCEGHFGEWQAAGKPMGWKPAKVGVFKPVPKVKPRKPEGPRMCSATSCNDKHYARGYCRRHLEQIRKHGEVRPNRKLSSETCSVDGCETKPEARDLCPKHYKRFMKHGDPLYVQKTVERSCSVEGCEDKYVAKGMCRRHYRTLIYKPSRAKGEASQKRVA